MEQERGFREFEPHEIDAGLEYAHRKCQEKLAPETLRIVGNVAGAIRLRDGCLPRTAAYGALDVYFKGKPRLTPERYEAYMRAIAKMFSVRSVEARNWRKELRWNGPQLEWRC